MKITKIETEWADGINWNDEDLDASVWNGFYVMIEVEDDEGNKFDLQYIAAGSVETDRDYENPNDFEKLEKLDSEIVNIADIKADEISARTIKQEINEVLNEFPV